MVLVVLAAVLVGCRLDADVAVDVAADGSGSVAVALTVDDELRDRLVAAGVDPAAALPAPAGAAWTSAAVQAQGATGQRLTASFDAPDQLAARVDDLVAALERDDGAVVDDVQLTLDDDGYRLALRAGLAPPAVAGVRVAGEDAVDLGRRAARGGATATLRATFPTTPTVVVGDGVVEGTTAVLDLPVDGLAQVVVTAPRPPRFRTGQVVVAGLLLGLVLLALAASRWARGR